VAEQRRAILEALLEHIPEGIAIVDSPGLRIQALSRYALEKEGLSREKIEGLSLPDQQETFLRLDGTEPGSIQELPIVRAALDGQTISNEEWLLKSPQEGNIPSW